MGMFDGLIEKMSGMIDDTKEAVKARDNQQWEYTEVYYGSWHMLGKDLASKGGNRWELITVLQIGEDFGAVFKRPKVEQEESDV